MTRNQIITRRGMTACVFAPLLRPHLARAQRAQVGEVAALRGTATAAFAGEAIRPLAPAAPVLLEDTLGTGSASRLTCRLQGGLDVRLGENASLRVDALTLHGPRPGVALHSFGGAMLVERAPAPAGAPVEITLPWARIGVRGTRVFAGAVDGAYAVFVARGRVAVVTARGEIVLTQGEGVDVAPSSPTRRGPDRRLGDVQRWSDARIARALALVD